jgi:hypothetical protein
MKESHKSIHLPIPWVGALDRWLQQSWKSSSHIPEFLACRVGGDLKSAKLNDTFGEALVTRMLGHLQKVRERLLMGLR